MVAEPLEKKHKIPDFRPGDTVRVHIRVVEGDSERVQAFEGIVISRRGRGQSQAFTVRKISFGVGVERTFPLFSIHIDRIELIKAGRVRRARLYYLRDLTGRAARLSEDEVRGAASVGEKPAEEPAKEPAKPEVSAKAAPAAKPDGVEPAPKRGEPSPQAGAPRELGAAPSPK